MEETIYRVIDFNGCKYLLDFHEVIKQSLELPDFYGRNLDALWDSLTGIMATPAHITLRGTKKASKDFQQFIEEMLVVFRRAETMYGEITVVVES